MKKALVLVLAFCAVASFVFAAGEPAAAKAVETVTLNGIIVDNVCAGTQNPEALADFLKTHTKECALMPNCVESGYSIYADGVLTKFDKASDAKIAEFLKKADSKLAVVVVADKSGNELSLVSIENKQEEPKM